MVPRYRVNPTGGGFVELQCDGEPDACDTRSTEDLCNLALGCTWK